MEFAEFSEYVQRIVFYQATNKKFSHFSIKRKCTLNLTIRQLAKLTNKSKSTTHRWIKKLEEQGVLKLATTKKCNFGEGDKRNKLYENMKFYLVVPVLDILTAKAKVRIYNYFKKKLKTDDGTLKIFLFHKNKKLQVNPSIEARSFYFYSHEQEINLEEIDLRAISLQKKRVAKDRVAEIAKVLLKIIVDT